MSAHFKDLFPFDISGLCYLRLYESLGGESIALAVELDDNPGASIVNGAEALMGRIAAAFGLQSRLFLIFPEAGAQWTEVVAAPDFSDIRFQSRIDHAVIEEIVGEPIELPQPGKCTAEALGGIDHPLLALIPEREPPANILDGMQVVAVAELPWAHNPWKCAHSERFQAIRKLYDKELSGEAPAGAHFFLSLDAELLSTCPYHQHDWLAIAAASVELLTKLPPTSSLDEVLHATESLLSSESDRCQLRLLFTEPIAWYPGSASITNGQHRACALKAAGAPLCVAMTHEPLGQNAIPAEPRRRAQATLAEYWIEGLGRPA